MVLRLTTLRNKKKLIRIEGRARGFKERRERRKRR